MARTIRRGKPSRNKHKYIKLGVIRHENRTIQYWAGYRLNGLPEWKDDLDDPRTYDEYFDEKVRLYHAEWGYHRGIPCYVRAVDVARQTRMHKAAITKGLKTGDFDIVLERMDKAEVRVWAWY